MGRPNIRIAALALSLIILALLIVYANPARFVELISKSNQVFILIAFILSTASVIIRILKWKVLLGNLSFTKIAPVQLLGVTISNFSPGKLAEPVKAVVLKLKEGRAVSSTLPSIIWERILDVIVLVLFAILGAYFFITLDARLMLIGIAVIIAFVVILILGLLVLYRKGFATKFFKVIKRLPFTSRISENFIQTFQESKVKKSRIAVSFILTVAAWALEGFILYYSLLALGITVSPLVLASMFALATLIGVASSLPGGIGSTDIVMSIFLGYLGIAAPLAVAGVLLARFLTLWYANVLGGISMIYLMKKLNISYRSILG